MGRLYHSGYYFSEETLKRAVKTDLLFQHSIIIITSFCKTHTLQKLLAASDGSCVPTREKTGESGTHK